MGHDYDMIKKYAAMRNTTLEAIADVAGIDRSTLYRRLRRGISSLSVGQATAICNYLDIPKCTVMSMLFG